MRWSSDAYEGSGWSLTVGDRQRFYSLRVEAMARVVYVFSAFAMASARSEIEKGFWIRPKLP